MKATLRNPRHGAFGWVPGGASFRGNLGTASATLLLALGCGVLVATNAAFSIALSAGVLAVGLAGMARRPVSAIGTASKPYRWVPAAWLGLLLVTVTNLYNRSPLEAATGNASAQNLIELIVYFIVALLILSRWRYVAALGSEKMRVGFWLAWPTLAVASTLWSPIPVFTFVRSMQLFVPISLAVLMARVWKHSPEIGRSLWTSTVKLLIHATTLLTLLGLALPSLWLEGRFTWYGAHPGTAGGVLACALIYMLVGGRSLTGFSAVGHWGRIALFSGTLVLSQTRSIVAGFLVAVVITLWFAGRRVPIARYAGFFYLACVGFVVWSVASADLITYAERGQGAQGIASINGRIPLWNLAFGELDTIKDQLLGFGYGASRVILYPRVEWAGDAHNSWIEWLLSIGMIGTLLALFGLVTLGVRLTRGTSGELSRFYLAALAIFVMEFVVTGAATRIALPDFGFVNLCLLLVLALLADGSTPNRHAEIHGVREDAARQPGRPVEINHRTT